MHKVELSIIQLAYMVINTQSVDLDNDGKYQWIKKAVLHEPKENYDNSIETYW